MSLQLPMSRGLSLPACLAQGLSFSCCPHRTLFFRDFRRNPSVYCKLVKLFVLLNPAFRSFFFPLSGNMFIVVTERVRTAEFGTIHCSLQGRMAGCSAGDFVGHEPALSRMVAAGAEQADSTSLI